MSATTTHRSERDCNPEPDPAQFDFTQVEVRATVAFLAYAGLGRSGPEYKPAFGKVVMKFRDRLIVRQAKKNFPDVVTAKNYICTGRKITQTDLADAESRIYAK